MVARILTSYIVHDINGSLGALTRLIYLIDCPGVVPPNANDTLKDILLRGVVRVENVEYPAQYIEALLNRCERRHFERTYDLRGYKDWEDFLDQLARKSGKLLSGGEADVDTVAKSLVNDFLRGRLPWFVPPPSREGAVDGETGAEDGIEGRKGRLGEMSGIVGKRERGKDAAEKEDSALQAGTIEDDEDDDDEVGEDVDDEDEAVSVSDIDEDGEFTGFVGGGGKSEDERGGGGGVVLPFSIGNLDAFAEASGDDNEAEEEEEEVGDDDTHGHKRRKRA